jgi:hypothetical protein
MYIYIYISVHQINNIKDELNIKSKSSSIRSMIKFMKKYKNEIKFAKETLLNSARQPAENKEILLPFLLKFFFTKFEINK